MMKVLPSALMTSVRDRLIGLQRKAEVAGQRPLQPEQILDRDRLIEAIELLEEFEVLLAGVGRQQRLDRITGRQEDEAVADDRHAKRDGNGKQDSPKRIVPHSGLSPCRRSHPQWTVFCLATTMPAAGIQSGDQQALWIRMWTEAGTGLKR